MRRRVSRFVASCALVYSGCDGALASDDARTAMDARSIDARENDSATSMDAAVTHPDARIVERACALPGCTHLDITCGGRTLGGDVQTQDAVGAVRGTIVFGTGGGGQQWPSEIAGMQALFTELRAIGYRIVQRRWSEPGWFVGTGGVATSSCAYAALLGWVRARFGGEPLCAAGLSGGSIEIAYALGRWDASTYLDAAVLCGGPSMADLTRTCPGHAPAQWTDRDCPALADRYLPTHTAACASQGGVACVNRGGADVIDSAYGGAPVCTSSVGMDLLAQDGLFAPGSTRNFSRTAVSFLLGEQECSAASLLFIDALGVGSGTSPARTLSVVPGAPHDIWSTTQGIAATRNAILATCAPR